MAYGKIKADTLVYDNSGTDTDVTIASLGNKADLNSPTFTGTPTVPGYAALSGATFTGNVVMSANLTVQGTTTTISSTTIEVADKNLELGKVDTPTDTTADGGGITLKGATDKTFNWVDSTDAWTSSEHIHLGDTKKIIFGAGSDFQIYHNGNHTYMIDTTGTGNVYLDTNKLHIRNAAGDENQIVASENGAIDLYYDNSKKLATTSAGVTVTGSVTDDKGDVRSIPRSGQGSAYTLVASDAGKAIGGTATITVPNGVFSAGDAVTIMNENSSSDITIAQGSGLTLWNATAGSNAAGGDRTLGVRGICTLYFPSSSQAYISGAGLS